jgi:hypothetical protein
MLLLVLICKDLFDKRAPQAMTNSGKTDGSSGKQPGGTLFFDSNSVACGAYI